MAIPTQPTLDNTAAAALENTTSDKTGLHYIGHDVGTEGDPNIATLITQLQYQLDMHLESLAQGKVIDEGGLEVGVHPCVYEIGGVKKTFNGQTGLTLTDDATNYIYLDGTSAVSAQVSTTAFPDDVLMLAEVTCASGDITVNQDARMRNHPAGVTENWATFVATADVDLDGNGMDDVAHVQATAPTELTISGDTITPTQGWHTVDTEGDAPTDDLTTITAGAATRGRLLCLQAAHTDRTVVIDTGGNITLDPNLIGQCILDDTTKAIWLFQHSDTEWIEVSRSDRYGATHSFDPSIDFDFNSATVDNVGGFCFSKSELTISGGSITQAYSHHTVDTEADAATDDLDTIVQSTTTFLIIRPAHTSRTVVVKHNVGANKIKLANDLDFEMDSTECALGLIWDGTQWQELFRAPVRPVDQRITSDPATDAAPYALGPIHVAGALSAGVSAIELYALIDFTLKNAAGVVVTPPSGGACIVDVQVDTGGGYSSIYANDGERINIGAGTYADVSASKWVSISAGDKVRIEILGTAGSPNGAEDLTVMLNGQAPMQAGE